MIQDYIQDENEKVTVGESTYQHQQDILLMKKGDHKFRPTRGVGIIEYIGDEDNNVMTQAIFSEFERDGMVVREIKVIDEQIHIDANYNG